MKNIDDYLNKHLFWKVSFKDILVCIIFFILMFMLVKCKRSTDNIVTVPTDSDVISKPIHNWLKPFIIESYGLKDGVLIIKMKKRRVANEIDEEYSNATVHFTTFCYINYNYEITKRALNGEILSDLERDNFLIKKEIQDAPPIKK